MSDSFIGAQTIYGVDREHDRPYLTRAWLGRLRLHIFHRGDDDPDPHDHPWSFWTFPLTSYVEEVFDPKTGKQRQRVVRAFRLHFRAATLASLDRLRTTLGTAAADDGGESRRRKYGTGNAPRPSNRDASAGGEPSPLAAGPKAEAAPLTGMPSDREGLHSEGAGVGPGAAAVDRDGEPAPVDLRSPAARPTRLGLPKYVSRNKSPTRGGEKWLYYFRFRAEGIARRLPDDPESAEFAAAHREALAAAEAARARRDNLAGLGTAELRDRIAAAPSPAEFRKRERRKRPSRAGSESKPEPEFEPGTAPRERRHLSWEAEEMSASDDARLVELVRRKGLGLTQCAALMRKSYATLTGAMERLGLSRVRGVA